MKVEVTGTDGGTGARLFRGRRGITGRGQAKERNPARDIKIAGGLFLPGALAAGRVRLRGAARQHRQRCRRDVPAGAEAREAYCSGPLAHWFDEAASSMCSLHDGGAKLTSRLFVTWAVCMRHMTETAMPSK